MPKPSVTIKDVARRSGVHASTVSRVLNPTTRSMVSAAVAARVLEVADQLEYRRNPLASALRTRRSYTVGVVIPDLTNPLFPPIVRGIERILGARGFIAILADSANSPQSELAIFETMQARQVDGLILATAHRRDPVVEACVEQRVPLVLVNRRSDHANVSSVTNDDEAGIRCALTHLVDLGHRHIAFVGGPQDTSTGFERYQAFLNAAAKSELPVDPRLIINAESFSEQAGQDALNDIFVGGRRFSAIVAANDLLALGCYDSLTARALKCPEDLSITGFNDTPFMHRVTPPLTTVRVPHDELGVRAAEILLEHIDVPDAPPKTLSLQPQLIVRGSTRRRLEVELEQAPKPPPTTATVRGSS